MADSQAEKLHAACDECRARKLKCSGESPRCSRCQREGIQCIYSPKKPMGRPRKRRREEAGTSTELQSIDSRTSDTAVPRTSSLPLGLMTPSEFTDFSNFGDFAGNTGMTHTPMTHLHHDAPITDISHQKQTSQLDFGLDLPIDPLLWNAPPAAPTMGQLTDSTTGASLGPCTCLSVVYLALSELQSMFTFAFPAVVHTQRNAMNIASTIMHCKRCPNELSTAIQNTQSLSALLFAIAERFHKILKAIDAEAEELERTGKRKPFRFGDSNPLMQHLHTGMPDCPLGFNIEMEGKDWKSLAKKVIRAEVMGGGSNPTPLNSLLDQFEQRQSKWHSDPETLDERTSVFGEQNCCRHQGEATCVRLINSVRAMVANMKWE